MIYTDNVDVVLKRHTLYPDIAQRMDIIRLKQLRNWLDNRNIKYSLVFEPLWARDYPYAINMRSEDALVFKLVHDL